jgi:hypothetical protein
LCNSKPGVEHVDAHGLAPPSAADQDPALGGVFDGVGGQVLQQPPQQPPIGTNRERARHEPQLQASVARQWRELDLELAQQVLDAKRRELWLHRAGIEPRNVEQRSDDFLDGLRRSVEIGHERAILALTLALDETGDVKPRGVEGLEDVVAGGGQKMCLGDTGLFGLSLGAGQGGVEAGQLFGALLYPSLQAFVGTLQRVRRGDAGGDVGQRGDEAGVWHAVGTHFDHHPAVGKPLKYRIGGRRVTLQTFDEEVIDLARPKRTALGHEAENVVKPDPNPDEVGWQLQDLAKAAVPTDQVEILVVDRDTLADLVERRLQNLAVVLDRRIGVVEQP